MIRSPDFCPVAQHLMTRTTLLTFLLFLGAAEAARAEDWFTVAGYPGDPAVDVVQIDPVPVSTRGNEVVMRVRVSRAAPRTSAQGTVFRSFNAEALIDCKRNYAYFVIARFHAEPEFRGEPFRTETYEGREKRPMAFREIAGNPSERIITAACKTLRN